VGDESAETIFVLMLNYVQDSTTLSSVTISATVAKTVLLALEILHEGGIVHGDISTSNVLVLEGNDCVDVMWIDFSSSWTDASPKQVAWESEKAAEYFGDLVSSG
jgi:tRNA A-37 threonylcarbamoyl transferase component Bud32